MATLKTSSKRKTTYVILAVLLLVSLVFFAWSLFSDASSDGAENTDPATDFVPIDPPDEQDDVSQEGYERDSAYEGLTEAEAVTKADEADVTYRIAVRDGEHFPLTMDYNPERINFTVEDGVVTRAEFY